MIEPYSAQWLALPVPYVRRVAEALGETVADWWDDPFDPRDATILLTGGDAMVWDEESGWRRGRFVAGRKGERTVLDDVRYLGGGVLPEPRLVPGLLTGTRRGRPAYRSFRDLHDGFDARLAAYAGALAAV
ncbi:DUF6292 family protein [Planobispora siamensis]|uniref:DUF6292 domain-containing protein n=1 Tax=Planobispora siamensis TaxID=936338 RepID=A0A8J3SBB0_9ACTN|nr:DUF6292 family protein [Planobispora siamensis]GIH91556.1 hypothetical protein Psi01_21860 [Planobispora siamensis]